MKIWYQSYSRIGFDPKWKSYEEDLKNYVQKISRPGTEVEIHGVEKMATKMTASDYIQHMHVAQVIDNAFQAEREGYDAFCLGGTLDLGAASLREVLDIPVVFIAESSFYAACLLAQKFSIITVNDVMLRKQMALIRDYGLEERCIPGAHMGSTMLELLEASRKNPQRLVKLFRETAAESIVQGAGVLVPGFGALSSFFGQEGIHEVDGVPIIDNIAISIKTAEMLVDLHRIGVKRRRTGTYGSLTKEELIAARKLYGAH